MIVHIYMQLRRAELVLHLSEHHGDATPGAALLIPVDDIDALHAELLAKDYPHARPGVRDEGWGRIMEVADPSGNKLRFWQRLVED